LIHIGIDPGQEGGIAILNDAGFYAAHVMPLNADRTINALAIHEILGRLSRAEGAIVCLEKAQAAPRQGVSSTFNYGAGFGKIQATVELLGIQCHLVRPQEWKKKLGLSGQPGKQAAIEFVQMWYPQCRLVQPRCKTPHDGIADAMCMAMYSSETYGRSKS
jgi:crossover junction endodeoxyribonuclease RuvC